MEIELPNYTNGVLNFHRVEEGIYRGGQPLDPEGWNYLFSLGIDTVIKLNDESTGKDDGALQHLMELIYIPISNIQQTLTEPDLDNIRSAAGIITKGTFVHCEHGQDRTGLVIAYYRVTKCQWAKRPAYEEMMRLGFHWELFGLLKAWADLTEGM